MQNSLDYLKIRKVGEEKYCFANTFIKIESEFYNNNIRPYNVLSAVISGFVFPFLLTVLIFYGKRKNILSSLSF